MAGSLRLDKWLWFTRLTKTRSEAVVLCESRHVRIDGRVVDRAHAPVRIGAIVAFARHGEVHVVRVLALPARRGAAAEAQAAYARLTPGANGPIDAPGQSRYEPGVSHLNHEAGV